MKLFRLILNHRKTVLVIVGILVLISLFLRSKVGVNYDLMKYLPESSDSTVAINEMKNEYGGTIPNVRALVPDVEIPEARMYKQKIEKIDGVTDVIWLDDVIDINQPIEMANDDEVEGYYKNGNALFTITVSDELTVQAVNEIKKVIGKNGAMEGSAVNTAGSTTSSQKEIGTLVRFILPLVFLILIVSTTSWFEPVLFMITIGVAIILNAGSNIIFGDISFVTNTDGSVLQLAVSMDYSIFLLHRFSECRKEGLEIKEAMLKALKKSVASIMSSGLTTAIGFISLLLMRFRIGPDMGRVLAKGIAFSLLSVLIFLPVITVSSYKLIDKTTHRSFLPSFSPFAKLVMHVTFPFAIVFLLVAVPAYLGQQKNEFDYGVSNMFGVQSDIGKEKAMIEKDFGLSNNMALLVPNGDVSKEKKLSDKLHKIPQVDTVLSYVDKIGNTIPNEYIDGDIKEKFLSKKYSRFVLQLSAPYEGDESFHIVETIKKIAKKYYGNSFHLAGTTVSAYDMREVVTKDNIYVNSIAIISVFIVLVIMFRQLALPCILLFVIETSIWVNLSVLYFQSSSVFFIAYLIISSVQLGATVDYAILLANRYLESRQKKQKREAIIETLSSVSASIMTSGTILTLTGFALGIICSNQVLSKLGYMLGRGALISMFAVLFVLPGCLYILDRFILTKRNKQ